MDLKILEQYLSDKILKKVAHPFHNISIWNYTKKTQANNIWDDVTMKCRALVLDSNGAIVARSFSKFFNYGQKECRIPINCNYKIYDKVDGSLGMLFYYNNDWIFCSRGSFVSDQAIYGIAMIPEQLYKDLNKDLSYSFEIIYPENKIIVDYGIQKELIYITSFKKDGTESDDSDIMIKHGIQSVQQYGSGNSGDSDNDGSGLFDSLLAKNTINKEGYVIRFDDGYRIKLKFENYLKMTHIKSKLTVAHIFENFKEETYIDENIPDEFYEYIDKIRTRIKEEYNNVYEIVTKEYEELEKLNLSIRDFAVKVKDNIYKFILFKLKHNIMIKPYIFQFIKPIILKIKNYECALKNPYDLINKQGILFILIGNYNDKNEWANTYIKDHINSIIVDKVKLNQTFFGTQDNTNKDNKNNKDDIIAHLYESIISSSLQRNLTVIAIDNKYNYNNIVETVHQCTKNTIIKFKIFDEKFEFTEQDLNNKFKFEDLGLISKNQKQECVIFDIDGTLSLMNGRNAYDNNNISKDTLNENVYKLYKQVKLANNCSIIICTGRSEKYSKETKIWLEKHSITYDEIYFRPIDSVIKDYIIKEDMYRKILEKYSISYIIDDRNQVVNHARRLGLSVFQVNYCSF